MDTRYEVISGSTIFYDGIDRMEALRTFRRECVRHLNAHVAISFYADGVLINRQEPAIKEVA